MDNETRLYKKRIEAVRVLLEDIQSCGFEEYIPRIKAVVQKEFKGRDFAKIDAIIARVEKTRVYAESYKDVAFFLQSHKEIATYTKELETLRGFIIKENVDYYEKAVKILLDTHAKAVLVLPAYKFKKLLESEDFKGLKNIWDKMEENKKEINQKVIALFASAMCMWIYIMHVCEHKSKTWKEAKDEYGALFGKLAKLAY